MLWDSLRFTSARRSPRRVMDHETDRTILRLLSEHLAEVREGRVNRLALFGSACAR